MKFIPFLSLLFMFSFSHATVPNHVTSDPLLVVVLMVKDEGAVMRATLAPFVDGGMNHFFIFDTGSTDNTIAQAEEFFKEKEITSYYIEQEPFINFAVSRNRALELAEERFPEATFMLFPDAEWYLVDGAQLLEFCEREKEGDCPSYMIRILCPSMDFYTQRLLRVRKKCRFAGAVHEAVTQISDKKVPANIYFDLRVSKRGAQKTVQRWKRDKDLLLKEHEEQPENPRTCFYLAQTYECLGDWERALHYYRKRTTLLGWPEENFMTWYRLGWALENFEAKSPDGWMHALECYLKAFSMNPKRIEPLIKIVQHYISENNHALAFLFASRACQMPYPAEDVLFVEKGAYDYLRYDLLGQCSWYISEYETGERAVRDALKAQPDLPHLLRNLAFYLDKKVQLRMKEQAVYA
jgi:tetratricopeptide (TPR) repeat protein